MNNNELAKEMAKRIKQEFGQINCLGNIERFLEKIMPIVKEVLSQDCVNRYSVNLGHQQPLGETIMEETTQNPF